MTSKSDLTNLIHRSFKDVELGKGVSLHEARLIDDHCHNSAEFEEARAKDNEKSWDEIEDRKILKIGDTLPFVNPYGFRFYLPAFT